MLAKRNIKQKKEEKALIERLSNLHISTLELSILKIFAEYLKNHTHPLEKLRSELKNLGFYPTIQPHRQLVIRVILHICHKVPMLFKYRPICDSFALKIIGTRDVLYKMIRNEKFFTINKCSMEVD